MSTNTTSLPFVALSKYNWSLSHFTTLPYNPLVYSLLSSFFAISLYLTLDLLIQIHLKFKKYTGLYYFSILATTVGIGMHAIAFILKLFVPGMADDGLNSLAANLASTAVAKIGWVLNTTGFSMVLWSRLGLVIRDGRIRTWTLCIIILDAILLHTPIIVFSFGLSTPSAREWLPYMSHMERIQIIGFTLQDLALSTFYTISSARLLDIRYTKQRRNLFIALAFAQLFGLVADSVMVALDFVDMFTLKACLHPLIYAVKMKIEFLVLNLLAAVVGGGMDGSVAWAGDGGTFTGGGRDDVTWPSSAVEAKGSSHIRGDGMGGCLRCSTVLGGQNRESARTEKSLLSMSEDSSTQLSLGSLESEVGVFGLVEGIARDGDLEDLERRYLGRYIPGRHCQGARGLF
ncbi:hypothetical protein EG327_001509 [Venturia inaequalis]|uniref:DUF7703 domain-containing protein n=1 Tax=Venturia inaequalis TaxID=5025 RepID=A0A8H3ZFM7_VENIN|nr:hypothetical protein EG327_001509 [Venturia inaequalis]